MYISLEIKMAPETHQRTKDFEEVQHTLGQQSNIRLVHAEGEPPDCYEIEYRMKGLVRESDGSIRKASQHTVLITLPFGYPHFPPAVKPLTPLFHPDIDPEAIRITAHWQNEPSLAKLILHIAEMISGKVYNLEDPFNQEAADWYAEHQAELPLEEDAGASEVSELDFGLEHLELEESEEKVQETESFDLDLGLELEAPEEQAVEVDIQPQIKEIQQHIQRKEMVIASRLMASLPSSASSPELEKMRRQVSSALQERDQLLQELKMLEDEDNFTQAQEVFEQLRAVAVDTPGLADIGRRLQQSQSMLDAFSLDEVQEPPAEAGKNEGKKKQKKAPPPPPKEKKPAAKVEVEREKIKEKSRIVRVVRREIPVAPFAVIGVLGALIIAGGFIYTRDTNVLLEAGLEWQEAESLTRRDNLEAAKHKVHIALSKVKTVFTPSREKRQLQQSLEELQQQLHHQQTPEERQRQAALAEQDRQRAEEQQAQARGAQIEEVLKRAQAAERGRNWKQAISLYEEAVALAHTEEEQEEMNKKLLNATFQYEVDQSKQIFSNTQDQWQGILEKLQKLQDMLVKNPGAFTEQHRQELEGLRVRSEFYQHLFDASEAYSNGKEADAISIYQQASKLLQEQAARFEPDERSAGERIKKTIVMLQMSLELNAAVQMERQNNLAATFRHYQEVQRLIKTLGADKDHGLQTLNQTVHNKLQTISKSLEQEKKLNWLHQNFERIFQEAFPTSQSSMLTRPEMVLDRTVNGRQIYKLSCIERSRGSSYRLELYYQYDPATDRWSLHRGQ
jgi:ubiquitin-protein ligase